METNVLNLPQKLFEKLELLQDSPIAEVEYYMDAGNLCDAIITIASDANGLLEDAKEALEENRPPSAHYLEWSIERLWQIQSIARIMEERVRNKNFTEIHNLLFYYKEAKEAIGGQQ